MMTLYGRWWRTSRTTHDRATILALFPPLTGAEDNRVPSQNVQQSRNLLDIGTGDALDVGELVTGTFNADRVVFAENRS